MLVSQEARTAAATRNPQFCQIEFGVDTSCWKHRVQLCSGRLSEISRVVRRYGRGRILRTVYLKPVRETSTRLGTLASLLIRSPCYGLNARLYPPKMRQRVSLQKDKHRRGTTTRP